MRAAVRSAIVAAAMIGMTGWSSEGQAQAWPVKTGRILVGYGTGGSTDATARLAAQYLGEQLGRPFIVENRPGATGTIAIEMVARAAPDGYTSVMIAGADAVVPAVRQDLPYSLDKDLAPVALVTAAPFILVVHPAVPAEDLKALIAHARNQPGRLNYSSAGVGSSGHIAGELLNMLAGTSIVHVPYKGTSDAATAVVSGQVQLSFPTGPAALPLLKAGKLKAIGVTSGRRSQLMPAMPTLAEGGMATFDRTGWYGLIAPAATPREVITRLNAEINAMLDKAEVKEVLARQGLEPQGGSPEQFGALIRRELQQNQQLARSVKLSAN